MAPFWWEKKKLTVNGLLVLMYKVIQTFGLTHTGSDNNTIIG